MMLMRDLQLESRVGYGAGVPFATWHVPLWRNPKRQQIVIFKPVVPAETQDIVKRVIGLPGETLDIRDGAVWIDGRKLNENYTQGRTERYEMQSPYKIPNDCYFVMADNRQDSFAIRFWGGV